MPLDSTESKFRVKKRPACESKEEGKNDPRGSMFGLPCRPCPLPAGKGKPPLELEKGKGNGKGKGKRAGKGKGKPPLDNENNTMQLDSTESKLLKRVDADKGLQELIVNMSRKLLPTVMGRLIKSSRFWEVQGGLEDYAKFLTLKVVCNDVSSMELCPTPKVDKNWHAHILYNVTEYIEDCSYILIACSPAYWLSQPKPIWINHRRIEDDEFLRMSTTSLKIHYLVWPASLVDEDFKREVEDFSEDEGHVGDCC
jgi:hypothetical protein|tara:strand:- start:102 stop:863 length:762 start_codon:yes stop_codon:yes gene_type:complete